MSVVQSPTTVDVGNPENILGLVYAETPDDDVEY